MMAQAPKGAEPKPQRFVPGKPGQPRSGMTAHALLQDADVVQQLTQGLQAFRRDNPSTKVKAPHIQQILPGTSAAQSRTILRKIKAAQAKAMVASADGMSQMGAYKSMKGDGT